jgi:hypothetical protein
MSKHNIYIVCTINQIFIEYQVDMWLKYELIPKILSD